MTLRPEYVKLLQDMAAMQVPELWEIPISQTRSFSQAQLKIAADLAPIHSITDRYIPGPTADLHIRMFRPNDSENLPCIIYFHGSGWTLGFIDLFNPCLSMLSKESESIVIAVNYQKAPEHPFPEPFNDCYATLEWAVNNATELGIDPKNISVGGDSAGGNLAAAVALRCRDEQLISLASQLLVYPCTNKDFSTQSYNRFASGYGLSTKAMQWFWDQYLQDGRHADNPYACPARATSLENSPPTILITAQYDPLTSDGENYRDLLARDGVEVVYKEFAGVIHGFFRAPEITSASNEAISFVSQELKKLRR
ncbi:Aes Esterase/lipase [Candidatus Nanopelagicaceae bacterium]